MSEQNTELPEVCFGQVRQNFCIDRILAERLFVLLEAEASQPRGNVHDSPPSPEFALRHTNEEVPTRHHHSVTTVMLLKR